MVRQASLRATSSERRVDGIPTGARGEAAYRGGPSLGEGGGPVPDDDALSPEVFDEAFAWISDAPRTNKLFDQVFGPFPAGVEPFSFVPRHGLDRVLAELRLGPGDHLVDLCCGRGGIGLWFAGVSGARLTGIDFSPGAIAGASRRAEAFVPRSRASFVVADAADTSLPAKTADAVVCIDALQQIPDKNGMLREVARVLRPGGRVVITTWERGDGAPEDLPPDYSITDVAALAVAAGLRILVRQECDDWLEQQRAFYQQVIAEDSDQAEPAIRMLADEGRSLLPHSASVRRLLLVASA
jgi:ubiquinone/menaquinone biosynthesis C-methylase UbiE